MTAALRDGRGCLTPAGVRILADAPPGQAPSDLVEHLAGCDRCQTRLLGSDPDALSRTARRDPRARWQRLGLVLLGLLAVLIGLAIASRTLGS